MDKQPLVKPLVPLPNEKQVKQGQTEQKEEKKKEDEAYQPQDRGCSCITWQPEE